MNTEMKTGKMFFILSLLLALLGMFYTIVYSTNYGTEEIDLKFTPFNSSEPLLNITFNNHAIINLATTNAIINTTIPTSSLKPTTVQKRKIFLMETSGKAFLNARQSCAVESAARRNPQMVVTVHFVSPTLDLSNPHISALSDIPNVRFNYLNLKKYFTGTPLQNWYKKGDWKKSSYRTSHLSDAIRFLTLWRFGGIYLDLDVVVLKNLDDLKNCAGLENKDIVAPGVMAFDQEHPFLLKCLVEFAATYSGSHWGWNGPYLITRVLKKECGQIKNLIEISRKKCNGVTALPTSAFYSVPWPEWKKFFDAKNAPNIMKSWNGSYLIHVWNKHSEKEPIRIGSGQPYELAAKEHCPSVYKLNIKNGTF